MKRKLISVCAAVCFAAGCEKTETERELERQEYLDQQQNECESKGGKYSRDSDSCQGSTGRRG